MQDFGSDPNAKDRARVLRLPGLHHQKDPARPWMVRVIHESGEQPYSWEQISATIRPLERPKKAGKAPAGTALDDPAKVRSALAVLDPDMEYSGWLAIGMALHHATAGGAEGLALWDEWSAGGKSYRSGETAYKWRTFGSGNGQPVTLASIFKMASATGWKDAPRGNGYDQAPPADYSDYPEAQGARDRPAGATRQSPGDKPQNGTPIKRIGDLLKEGYTYDWLIKYWIECLQTIVIFGDSQACKTLLAIDLACCIALGIDWLGCRVKQGAVVFVVGEGAGTGIRRRFRAWEIANGYSLAYAPIYIVEQHTTLPLDAARLIADIRATIEQDGGAVEIIFLDTLSRTITGSERESKDFSAYQRALDDIRAEFHCAAAFLHHVGHADKSRERGASEIGSNADVRLKMETLPDETRQLTALKLEDGAMPDPLFFKLSVVELGELDEDGDPIMSVVLRQIQGYQLEQQQRPLSKNSKLLLAVLTNLLTTDMHPDGVTISTTLRAAFYETLRRNKPDLEADSLRTIFSRALSALWEAGKIAYTGIDNTRVRLAEPEETDA